MSPEFEIISINTNQLLSSLYLKFPNNSVVIVEVVFGLFASEKLEGVEPLSETLEILLTLKLIRKDLNIIRIRNKAKPFSRKNVHWLNFFI